MGQIRVKEFFDEYSYTLTYVVYDTESKDAVVIDPVLDYEPASSKVSRESINKVLSYVKEEQLEVHYILETHAHADHITGAYVLRDELKGTKIGVGQRITEVQSAFKELYNLDRILADGSQFDVLLTENSDLDLGNFKVKTIFTPGHTPACSSYLIGDKLFTGDSLFMPDYGTGRCDFPGGSAAELYDSIHGKLYALPDAVEAYTGHDYMPEGRPLKFKSTIAEQKNENIHLKQSTTKADFIAFRTKRDEGLQAPRLLLPSLQINIEAGLLPSEESNGKKYLKIPLND